MFWIAIIPMFISGLDMVLQGFGIERKELYFLSVASFIYALFFIILQTIPILWYIVQRFSLMFSSVIGSIVGKSLLLGPSTSGLWTIITFLISLLVSFLLQNKKHQKMTRFIFAIFGLFISWVVYLFILVFVDFESKDVMDLYYVLFILCLAPLFFYLSKNGFKKSKPKQLRFKAAELKRIARTGSIWALLLLFISSTILTTFFCVSVDRQDNQKILFYGQNMLGTWDIPAYGTYGQEAVGMFGHLPIYLNESGYKIEIHIENRTSFLNTSQPQYENITRYINLTDYVTLIESPKITRDILKDVDTFVVININKSFSSDEQEIIWEFVKNGGSLLVLGDHTDVAGIRQPLNNLLKPVQIKYNFDSALPLDSKFNWITCYQLPYHPTTYHLDTMDQIQVSVGASLDISMNSFPLIIGRYGLSDEGNRSNENMAYLGNYEYDSGEQLGDIVLAAISYYGAGRVMVFGDTSSFQNSALYYSYPFIYSIFTWLHSQETAAAKYSQMGVSIVILASSFIIYVISFKKNNIFSISLPVVLCISIVFSIIVNPIFVNNVHMVDEADNIAYIDSSHTERFSLEPYTDNSLSGIMINLVRNNYLPLILRDFSKEQVANSKIIIFNAPTEKFSNDEVDFLKQYMSDGGIVILATGYDDKYASCPLLTEFGLDVEDIPLGPVPEPYVDNVSEYEPLFVDGWPIIFDEENNSQISFYNFTIAGWKSKYHLMVFTKYRKGGLMLISDSQYLLDKNIESIYDYWPGNILLLKYVFDEIKSMEAQK